MKIVVLDGYTLNPGDLSWDELKKYGELTVYDRTTYDPKEETKTIESKIIDRAGDAEIIFVNKTPLKAQTLKRLDKLKFICVLATGYNVVDVQAAKELGIIVTNIPTYGTTAVAQMAFALLLEMCHHVWAHSEEVKKGAWTNNADWCFWNYPLIELAGKTIGIVGYGRIGQSVGVIAQAFGMKVLAYDLYKNTKLENENLKYAEMDELLKYSDVISLHCPLFESNTGIINKASIDKMKNGVMILNNSRGPLIVEQDLADALNSGKVSGAAVDVVSTEPIKMDNPLLKAKNCIITPHISWAPKESRQRLMNIAVNNFKQFLDNNFINVVNK
ncbi:MAG TPA: D-2-hydroxyacid dehydrogenase [Clostridiaceae bacterium]